MPAIRPRLRLRASRKGRSAFAAPSATHDRLSDLDWAGENPGNLRARCYVPAGIEGPGAARRRPPRLHPGRGGLRSRLGLVDARRPARLHPALSGAEAGQQPDAVLQLVLRQRRQARHGRGRVDPVDDRGDEEGARRDPERIFVTGLSAGGAMASAMLATYPETFAAGAIIAGRRLWLRGRRHRGVRLHGRPRPERRRERSAASVRARLGAQGPVAAGPGLAGQRRPHRGAEQRRFDRPAMDPSARRRPGAGPERPGRRLSPPDLAGRERRAAGRAI